jgi:hypothetical protein
VGKGSIQRIPNSILDRLPGYTAHTQDLLTPRGSTEQRREITRKMLIQGLMGLRAPGFGRAARLETVPQKDPSITGGGSPFYGDAVPGNSLNLVQRPGVQTAAEVNRVPSYRLNLSPANTKGNNNPPLTSSEISSWMDQAKIPHRVSQNGQFGTEYLTVQERRPQTNSPLPTVHIRVPNDRHVGRPANSPREARNRFDTGSEPAYNAGYAPDPRITQNRSGGSYSEPQNLFDALRWRFSRSPDGQFLVPEGQAPVGRYPMEPLPPGPPKTDPNQLRLLGQAGAGVLGTEEMLRYLNGQGN